MVLKSQIFFLDQFQAIRKQTIAIVLVLRTGTGEEKGGEGRDGGSGGSGVQCNNFRDNNF